MNGDRFAQSVRRKDRIGGGGAAVLHGRQEVGTHRFEPALPADRRPVAPALMLLAGGTAAMLVVTCLYRMRGFLAAWIAGLVTALLEVAMAARSFEGDADLERRASTLTMIVVVIAAAGAYGVGRRLMQKPAAAVIPS